MASLAFYLYGIIFLLCLIIVIEVVLFILRLKLSKIRKKAPEGASKAQIKALNYDSEYIERREMNNGKGRRLEEAERGAEGTRRGESPTSEQIERLREEIRRRKSELEKNR